MTEKEFKKKKMLEDILYLQNYYKIDGKYVLPEDEKILLNLTIKSISRYLNVL